MIQRRGKKKRNDRIFASDSLQSVHEAIRGILPENAVKEALAAEDFFVEAVCGDERQVLVLALCDAGAESDSRAC